MISDFDWSKVGEVLDKDPLKVLSFTEAIVQKASNVGVSEVLSVDFEDVGETMKYLQKQVKRLENKMDAWEMFKETEAGKEYTAKLAEETEKMRANAFRSRMHTPTSSGSGSASASASATDATPHTGSSTASSTASTLFIVTIPKIPDGFEEYTEEDGRKHYTYTGRLKTATYKDKDLKYNSGVVMEWIQQRLDPVWRNAIKHITEKGEQAYRQLREVYNFIRLNGLGDARDLHGRLTQMVTDQGQAVTPVDVGVLLDNLTIIRARMDMHRAALLEQGKSCPVTPTDDYWINAVERAVKTGAAMNLIEVTLNGLREASWSDFKAGLKKITDRAEMAKAGQPKGVFVPGVLPTAGSSSGGGGIALMAYGGGDADHDLQADFLGTMQEQVQVQQEMDAQSSSSSSSGGLGGDPAAMAFLANAMPGKAAGSGKGVCYSYQKGTCTRGSSCRFKHELAGERVQQAAMKVDARGYDICFAHTTKSCGRGDSCRFSNDPATGTRPAGSQAKKKDGGGGGRLPI